VERSDTKNKAGLLTRPYFIRRTHQN